MTHRGFDDSKICNWISDIRRTFSQYDCTHIIFVVFILKGSKKLKAHPWTRINPNSNGFSNEIWLHWVTKKLIWISYNYYNCCFCSIHNFMKLCGLLSFEYSSFPINSESHFEITIELTVHSEIRTFVLNGIPNVNNITDLELTFQGQLILLIRNIHCSWQNFIHNF